MTPAIGLHTVLIGIILLLLLGARYDWPLSQLPELHTGDQRYVPQPPSSSIVNSTAVASYNVRLLHQNVVHKLLTGVPLTVVVLGGSISQGHGTESPEQLYAAQLEAWFNRYYPVTQPQSNHTVYNLARRSTGSDMFSVCIDTLLALHPPLNDVGTKVDLVLVEFAVNDPYTQASALRPSGNIEHIVRYWLRRNTAVMLIEMSAIGNIKQADELPVQIGSGSYALPVALWYGIPLVDVAKFWASLLETPLIREFYNYAEGIDGVHTNYHGHALIAALVVAELKQHMQWLDHRQHHSCTVSAQYIMTNGPYHYCNTTCLLNLLSLQPDKSFVYSPVATWHGVDVHSTPIGVSVCFTYEDGMRPRLSSDIIPDDFGGTCYLGKYGWYNNLPLQVTQHAGWEYGLLDSHVTMGNKQGWHSNSLDHGLLQFATNISATTDRLGVFYLRSWDECGSAAVWCTDSHNNTCSDVQVLHCHWQEQSRLLQLSLLDLYAAYKNQSKVTTLYINIRVVQGHRFMAYGYLGG